MSLQTLPIPFLSESGHPHLKRTQSNDNWEMEQLKKCKHSE